MSVDGPIGLVLVVKDEVHDIAGWLAWHLALGFDTIFVIDDGSTDGTDQLVKAAGRSFDVRYSTAVQDHPFFYERQQREYRKALSRLKDEFSWLCFLDADEYLLLSADASISTFLARFPGADGVGLNWCLHGNNGHVLRPLLPAPMAYPRRSGADLAINRHVKSLVRPDRIGSTWINVHWFDIEPAAYVNAEGSRLEWSSTLGIIKGTPSFQTAHVMHFQSRSMEHFIDRARKRRDTQVDVRSWSNEDWNSEGGRTLPDLLTPMFETLATIEYETSAMLVALLAKHLRRPNSESRPSTDHADTDIASDPPPTSPDISSPPAVSVHTIRTHFGSYIRLDPSTDLVVHVSDNPGLFPPLFLIRSPAVPSDALLVAVGQKGRPLRLIGDRQAATVIRLHVTAALDGQVTLHLPETSRFLSAEPTDFASGVRRIAADRKSAQAWEMYTLPDAASGALERSVLKMAEAYFSLVLKGVTAAELGPWLAEHSPVLTAPLLQIVLRQMGRKEHLRLVSRLAGNVPLELLSGSSYS